MTFRKFDVGENHRTKGKGARDDCQVRALTSARGLSYGASWDLLYVIQGELRHCFLPLVEALSLMPTRLGAFRKLDFPAQKGKPRMTGETFCKKHPKGRFILRMAGHVACVKDGVLLDTFDSSWKCVYTAWEIEPLCIDCNDPHPHSHIVGTDESYG